MLVGPAYHHAIFDGPLIMKDPMTYSTIFFILEYLLIFI
jgi:hypothetical protein